MSAAYRVNDLPRNAAVSSFRKHTDNVSVTQVAEPPETTHLRMTLHLPGPVGALLSIIAALRNSKSQHMIAAVHDEGAISAVSIIRES